MVCKKQLSEKAGPRKLSRARKHWMTSRLMIKCAKTFFVCIQVRPHSALDLLRRPLESMFRRVFQEEFQKGIDRYWSQIPRSASAQRSPKYWSKLLQNFLKIGHLTRTVISLTARICYDKYVSDDRYKLCFVTKLKNVIYTMDTIEGESGGPIQVSMLDADHRIVKSSPLASAKVKIVALHGNFCADARETWTTNEFEKSMVSRTNENKKALLVGDLEFSLQSGEAYFCKAHFSDISKWASGGKFRLGVKLIDGRGERVQEGISNPFVVLHHRGKGSEKPNIPSLQDEVWKLKKVAKNGDIHNKLKQEGIIIVGDLLNCSQNDESKVIKILGHNWKITIQHAKKSVQDKMLCPNLPNGVSSEGLNEMIQPSNYSSQTDNNFAREWAQNIYNMPAQNEISNPAPPIVGNLYHGSSSSQPDHSDNLMELSDNLMELLHEGHGTAPEGILDMELDLNQHLPVSFDIVTKQPQTTSNMFDNCHNEINYPAPATDGNFFHGSCSLQPDTFDHLKEWCHQDQVASSEGNPVIEEDPIDNFDIDLYLSEPDPTEVDTCRYNVIHDGSVSQGNRLHDGLVQHRLHFKMLEGANDQSMQDVYSGTYL